MPLKSIPITKELNEIYTSTSLLSQGERWNSLLESFKLEFQGSEVEFIARAPGRVNVIGEHIDYCGFSVLPAAIERDCLIAYSTTPSTTLSSKLSQPSKKGNTIITLKNLESKYTSTEFEVDLKSDGKDLEMPKQHHWSSYFIAGTKGILAHMYSNPAITSPSPTNILILVTGSVPTGSGLSSSSAMTTASATAILQIAGRSSGGGLVARRELTQVAIESERLVGVNSGGMDQSASVFSLPDHLLHIEFVPTLLATPIPLPRTNPAFSFVIVNTLITSDKAVTAKFCYNLRVVETLLGARLLAHHLSIPIPSATSPPLTYKAVQDYYFSHPSLHSHTRSTSHPTTTSHPALVSNHSHLVPELIRKQFELKIMLGLAAEALAGPGMETGLTWTEVSRRLGREEEELRKEVVGDNEVEAVGGRLKIWTRARHVFSEALRVYQFVDLLSTSAPEASESFDSQDGTSNPSTTTTTLEDSSELLNKMGKLMNDSQTSCKEDYECSCPEIDEIVKLARSNGALGSRVTGAGWGGATVSLVPEPLVPSFIKAIRENYYAKKFPHLSEEELQDVCFATKPEAGAGIYQVSN